VVFFSSSLNDYSIVFGGYIASAVDLLAHTHLVSSVSYTGVTKSLSVRFPFALKADVSYHASTYEYNGEVHVSLDDTEFGSAKIRLLTRL